MRDPVTQLKILSRAPGTARQYTARYIQGTPRRAVRARIVDAGAALPLGGTTFDVPSGTVALGEVIALRGQFFRVDGIEPLAPWFTRERLATTQQQGPFSEAPTEPFRIMVDGDTISADGNVLVLT